MTRIVPWITREVTPSPTMQAHNCEWSKEQYEPYQDEVPCTSSLTEINNRDKNKINQIIHKQLIRDTQKKKAKPIQEKNEVAKKKMETPPKTKDNTSARTINSLSPCQRQRTVFHRGFPRCPHCYDSITEIPDRDI